MSEFLPFLSLRSYGETVRPYMKEESVFPPSVSDTYEHEGKEDGTQIKYFYRALLYAFNYVDDSVEVISSPTATRIVKGETDIPRKYNRWKEITVTDEISDGIENYFKDYIIPNILPEYLDEVNSGVLQVIKKDSDIGPEKQKELASALKEHGAARFHAEVLLFIFQREKYEKENARLAKRASPDELAINDGAIKTAIRNLPTRGYRFIPRETVQKEIEEGFRGKRRMQILAGGAGLGKTSLAREYAWEKRKKYSYICWINAEREDGIKESCAEFLEICGEEIKPSENIRLKFRRFFEQHKSWLIIFDNADCNTDAKMLQSYIPQADWGHILLTTRYSGQFCGQDPIEIGVFMEGDAVNFIMDRCQAAEADEAFELAEHLAGHPLALEYATAYINRTHITIPNYLKLLRAHGIKPLDDKDVGPLDYDKTVREAYHVTLDKLHEQAEGGDEIAKAACQFINYSSLMAPDRIGLRMFDGATEEQIPAPLGAVCSDELKRNKLYRMLTEYSLFHAGRSSTLSVHRLLQGIIRDELGDQKERTAKMLIEYCSLNLAPLFRLYAESDKASHRMFSPILDAVTHLRALEQHAGIKSSIIKPMSNIADTVISQSH